MKNIFQQKKQWFLIFSRIPFQKRNVTKIYQNLMQNIRIFAKIKTPEKLQIQVSFIRIVGWLIRKMNKTKKN
jgi:hypothetical protein